MFIGLDDTDSLKGGCTTYLAALLCRELGTTTRPRLIRLNPNIPYKTRGNGAVAIEVDGNPARIKETALKLVKKRAHTQDKRTNPGVAFIDNLNSKNKDILNEFYQRAVSELVTIEEADETAARAVAETHKFNNGRGIIGALAAIGAELDDRTYELIAYRTKENCGKPKKIDEDSVFLMHEQFHPKVFNSIDPETNQILITPHGYDPVFCGIRGESPGAVLKAWKAIKPLEEIELTQIFETNQATDAHLRNRKISELKPHDCAILEGAVAKDPRTIEGGHVLFSIADSTAEIDCAAYEPTGGFREIARKLLPGDRIRAYGGIGKYINTLNLEKIEILELVKAYKKESPACCGRRMTSAGKDKGFKCRKCGKRKDSNSAATQEIPRGLKEGFYEAPPRAMRHLSKPIIRAQQ